jgi:hypothetical protein
MIPHIFHFVFGLKEQNEPFHLMYYLCLASCLEVNKPDAVFFHYHHEPYGEWWERIKPRLTLRQIEPESFVADYHYDDTLVGSFRYAHLADFARLRILLEEGGIYADIDTLFLRPLPTNWFSRQFILGHEKPLVAAKGGSLCNALIASAPGAEFGRLWLDKMREAFDGTWSNHACQLPYDLSCQYPELIDIEPASSFFYLDYTARAIRNLFLRCVTLPGNAYSLHLWNHLWWNPKRLDFSNFHSGLLTVDYVRYANTTYAKNAKKFLPPEVATSRGSYLRQRLQSAYYYVLYKATAQHWSIARIVERYLS